MARRLSLVVNGKIRVNVTASTKCEKSTVVDSKTTEITYMDGTVVRITLPTVPTTSIVIEDAEGI